MHAQCDKDIARANKVLLDKSKDLNKTDIRQIKSLIKAAKIQQQHGDFNGCLDKIDRALTLLNEDASSKQRTKTDK